MLVDVLGEVGRPLECSTSARLDPHRVRGSSTQGFTDQRRFRGSLALGASGQGAMDLVVDVDAGLRMVTRSYELSPVTR